MKIVKKESSRLGTRLYSPWDENSTISYKRRGDGNEYHQNDILSAFFQNIKLLIRTKGKEREKNHEKQSKRDELILDQFRQDGIATTI